MIPVISRALDLQQRSIDSLFELLTQADYIVIEASMGKRHDKRAIADLIDLFTSQQFYDLEEKLRRSAAATVVARSFAPLIEYEAPSKSEANEAKPRRKAAPKDP